LSEGGSGWTCLGPGPAHAMAPEEVERLRSIDEAFIRCRTCGQLYYYRCYELNDWSHGHDYCDYTYIWAVIDAHETEALRRDPNYKPRDGRFHRYDTGWQAE
jgi:hypothetical protein